MEKAIHITNPENLKYFREGKYQRIYWGVEFCQSLIPTIQDTKRILTFAKEHNLRFTLVTPFVTERGLRKLKEILIWLNDNRIECEIVVNDWGVLEYSHTRFSGFFELALGRLLVRQQSNPEMKRVAQKQPPFAVRGRNGKIRVIVHHVPDKQYQEGVKASYVSTPAIANLLSSFGIKRVELNNLIQTVTVEDMTFRKSLYTPFVNISTTRFCPMESTFQKTYRINVCQKECQKYCDILRCRAIPKLIYKRGNTTFYKNPLHIRKVTGKGIDRVVFQPEIPF